MDLLKGTAEHSDCYGVEEKVRFEQYLAGQMAKIQLDNKDDDFLYERMLTMYANPAINLQKAK